MLPTKNVSPHRRQTPTSKVWLLGWSGHVVRRSRNSRGPPPAWSARHTKPPSRALKKKWYRARINAGAASLSRAKLAALISPRSARPPLAAAASSPKTFGWTSESARAPCEHAWWSAMTRGSPWRTHQNAFAQSASVRAFGDAADSTAPQSHSDVSEWVAADSAPRRHDNAD